MTCAITVANWFIDRVVASDQHASVLRIMDFAYQAQGYHLAEHGVPLFHDRIEAWGHGVVIPTIYRAFQHDALDLRYTRETNGAPLTKRDIQTMERVWSRYGKTKVEDLRTECRAYLSPWTIMREVSAEPIPMPLGLIELSFKHAMTT